MTQELQERLQQWYELGLDDQQIITTVCDNWEQQHEIDQRLATVLVENQKVSQVSETINEEQELQEQAEKKTVELTSEQEQSTTHNEEDEEMFESAKNVEEIIETEEDIDITGILPESNVPMPDLEEVKDLSKCHICDGEVFKSGAKKSLCKDNDCKGYSIEVMRKMKVEDFEQIWETKNGISDLVEEETQVDEEVYAEHIQEPEETTITIDIEEYESLIKDQNALRKIVEVINTELIIK